MILHIEHAIEGGTLEAIVETIKKYDFLDGLETAGRAAKEVKRNQQLRLEGEQPAALRLLLNHLQQNNLVQSAALPRSYTNIMVNRYQSGMEYGLHVDDALMGHTRTDISFTLGLTPSDNFEGGELVLEDTTGERSWKLGQGELLLYPSHYLHRVNPVKTGERLAMVGWIQSHIRDSQQREMLFDLKCSMSEEFEQRGKTTQYDRLSKTYNNLLRHWAE
ncbi:Fe2+-dependent dioxygenase [Kangiella sediminilitoris]|uniref:Nuclease PIN n=1 Tax=Kangiella sediminilitoris TaxID=1144748 RepID=A0A1B3BDB5_9GAMM|nr:Fe2+-dependent dioxygenase [Kangiella sediminilitoris]AOE50824.1 nuclease PIN [Kangiella sediminilitoris]